MDTGNGNGNINSISTSMGLSCKAISTFEQEQRKCQIHKNKMFANLNPLNEISLHEESSLSVEEYVEQHVEQKQVAQPLVNDYSFLESWTCRYCTFPNDHQSQSCYYCSHTHIPDPIEASPDNTHTQQCVSVSAYQPEPVASTQTQIQENFQKLPSCDDECHKKQLGALTTHILSLKREFLTETRATRHILDAHKHVTFVAHLCVTSKKFNKKFSYRDCVLLSPYGILLLQNPKRGGSLTMVLSAWDITVDDAMFGGCKVNRCTFEHTITHSIEVMMIGSEYDHVVALLAAT